MALINRTPGTRLTPPRDLREKRKAYQRETILQTLRITGHIGQWHKTLRDMQRIIDDCTPVVSSDGSSVVSRYLTEEDKERFALLKAVADQHWKVIDRFGPKIEADKDNGATGHDIAVTAALSAAAEIVARLAQSGAVPDLPVLGANGPVVSDQVSAEPIRHGTDRPDGSVLLLTDERSTEQP